MANEQVFLATPVLGGGGRVVASPFQFLFTGEDNLRVVIANSKTGVVVRLAGRFLQTGATAPQAFQQDFTPTSDRSANVFDVALGTGFLLNLSLVVLSGAPLVGQTYAMARIIRGLSGATVVLGALLGGQITQQQHLAYPGSPIVSSTDGEPALRTITGTTPAAGAEWLETVPTGARWELQLLRMIFTTSAVAISRVPQFQVSNGADRLYQTVNPTTVNNLQTFTVYLSQNLPYGSIAASLIFNWPIPQPTRLLAGASFGSSTAVIQAGDQWSAPVYTVREWLEVN